MHTLKNKIAQVLDSGPGHSSPPSPYFRVDLHSRLIVAFALSSTVDFTAESILTSAYTFTLTFTVTLALCFQCFQIYFQPGQWG